MGRAAWLLLALLPASLALRAAPARAHARPASLVHLAFEPGDPSHVVAQATWGLAVSEDGTGSFSWTCAAAFGVDARNQDPPLAVTAGGAVLLATFDGLVRGAPGGCDFDLPSPELEDVFVIDVVSDPRDPRAAVAVRTGSDIEDRLFRTEDGGETWAPLGVGFDLMLVDRVRLTAADPLRIYASGAVSARPDRARRALVRVSRDGGESYEEAEPALLEGETNILVMAASPTDPDLAFARVTHFNGEMAPERVLRSRDGGRTFEHVADVVDPGGAVFSEDGLTVWIGSRLGGVFRSDDLGDTFERVSDRTARCIVRSGESLFLCADEAVDGAALFRSDDGGDTFAPVVRLSDVRTMTACPRCTEVGYTCPRWLPDVAYDLHFDAGVVTDFADGGTGAPRDAAVPAECLPDGGPGDGGPTDAGAGPPAGNGCGCAAPGQPDAATGRFGLALLALALAAQSRRRRMSAAPTRPARTKSGA